MTAAAPVMIDDDPSGPSALDLFQECFADAASQLAASGRIKGPPAMASCASEIRRVAAGGWRLEVGSRPQMFYLAASQRVMRVDGASMGPVLDRALSLVLGWDEASLRSAVAAVSGASLSRVVVLEMAKLFVAHEFVHVRQQLGSTQYMDSDHYGAPVVPIDYQADVAAIWYVSRVTHRPAGMTHRGHLLLLVAIHVAVMLAFAGIGGASDEIERASFDRLLVWHFQYMRIAGADAEPDMDHPSVQSMPVFAFPRIDGAIGEMVSRGRAEASANDRPDVLSDMVVSLAGADGVLGLLRFPSTDRGRIGQMVGSLIGGDLASTREALEEFRIFQASALDFERPDAAMLAIERVMAMAEALLAVPDRLQLQDPALLAFLRQAELLVVRTRPRLVGEGLAELRDWWSHGAAAWLEREAAALTGDALDAALRTHVARIAARIGTAE